MKKIRDLEAKDFPGVNIVKFQEWKNAQKERTKKSYIDTPIALVLILSIFIFKGFLPFILFIIGVISLLAYSLPTTIKILKLQKELGITLKDIQKARKNKYGSNLKEDKGRNVIEADSKEDNGEVEYESNLKEEKGVNEFRIVEKEDIKENNRFSNIIILFLMSAFIGCASYAFLSVTKIIDGFHNAERIKNVVLIVFFLSSFIIFLISNLKQTKKL